MNKTSALSLYYNINDFYEYPIRSLIFLLKKIKIAELFKTHVKDPRLRKGKYSLESLLMIGICIFLFRNQSKNYFYQAFYQGRSYQSIAKLVGINNLKYFPVIKTLDDLFLMLNPQNLEPILFNLFKILLQKKVVKSDKGFFIQIDAYTSHCYQETSLHSPCPFCLKRENENKIWYFHINVCASIVFPGGFQFPLYVHRLKSQNSWTTLSDNKFKQECELTALPFILNKIREYFPRLKLTVLLDALYANAPVLALLEKYRMGYAIVLKKLAISKKLAKGGKVQQTAQQVFEKDRFDVVQSFKFCTAAHGPFILNVVDLSEIAKKKQTKRFAVIHLRKVHWQWIVHQTLNQNNVFSICANARLRWHGEDLFNTLKNRGFYAKHDFSINFQASSIWLSLMMIAFALSSLLLHSQFGILSRKKGCSIQFFMRQMMMDLLYFLPSFLFDSPYPKQLRFFINPQAG